MIRLTPPFVEPGFAALITPNGDRFKIFGADSTYNTFHTHPVVGFRMDDIAAASAEMEAYGIEFIDPIHTEEDGNAWTHFRAQDGFVYSLTFVPGYPAD